MDLERHDPGSEPGIRASDAERDRVVGLLKQHFTDGRLSLDEFSERMDVAYSARTRGELVSTLRELPVLAPPVLASRPVPQRPHGRVRNSLPLPAFPMAMLAILLIMLVVFSRGILLWPMFAVLFFMGRGHGRRHHYGYGNHGDWSHRRGYRG
jgi:hypothetical protein